MFEIMFDILSNAKGVEIDDYEKEDEYQKGYIDFEYNDEIYTVWFVDDKVEKIVPYELN